MEEETDVVCFFLVGFAVVVTVALTVLEDIRLIQGSLMLCTGTVDPNMVYTPKMSNLSLLKRRREST